MNTSLEHLPEHKQKQLREITGIIVKAVDPEKVILFGSHATGRWVEHRYTEGGITYEYITPRGASPGYPNGYIKYMNANGQGVDPYTGKTLSNAQNHFPIKR